MVPERYEGESEFSYHKRLIYGKCEDMSLADSDFSELSDPLYGKTYSSDNARKMIKGSYLTLKAMERSAEHEMIHTDAADILEEKRLELQKERRKFYDQRREYNKLVTTDARFERLQERIADAAANLIADRPLRESVPNDLGYLNASDTEGVLVLCDWHYGMTTDNIWNTYDTATCKRRLAHVIHETIERLKLHKPRVLHVVLLGDLCHGAVHTSARVASEELVCDQLMHAAELVAEAIDILSEHVGKIIVHSTYGNHMRTVQKKKDSIHADNMERIIPWWLNYRLKDYDRVEIDTDTEHEFIVFNACGSNIVATHGDLDRIASSPRLLGQLFSKKFGIDINCVLLGDKHHLEEFAELGVDAVLCRALCGTDNYANEHRLYDVPGQTLIFFKEGVGRDASYNIKA